MRHYVFIVHDLFPFLLMFSLIVEANPKALALVSKVTLIAILHLGSG